MRTIPERSTHFIEWDKLSVEEKDKIMEWMTTPTLIRPKQAFLSMLLFEDIYTVSKDMNISTSTANNYIKKIRARFGIYLKKHLMKHICNRCSLEQGGIEPLPSSCANDYVRCDRCRERTYVYPVYECKITVQ